MHLDVKGRFDLAGCAGEFHPLASFRDVIHLEAVSLKPRGDLLDVTIRRAELRSIIMRR